MRLSNTSFNLAWLISANLVLAVLSPAALHGQQPEKCFLWKVTSKSATIYLLGTIHVAHPDLYPLPKEIEEAFALSRILAVEHDSEKIDKVKLNELTQQKAIYPGGQSLSRNLSEETMALLRGFCKEHKLNVQDFERMRPWWVNMALSGDVETRSDGWSIELGIDKYFLKKAAAAKKDVRELEPLESAFWSATLSPEMQQFYLFMTLKDDKDGIKFPLRKVGEAWKKGDTKAMEELIVDNEVRRHPQYKEVLQKMLDERNRKMTEKIDGYLKDRDTVFVAVGAGHLIGPNGIVAQLERLGHRVTQVARTPAVKSGP